MKLRFYGAPGRTIATILAIVTVLLTAGSQATAETIKIVALGASNANGKGVASSEAWPAQLERMLRAKGYDVSVTVNAVSGDTSGMVLARAASASAGARVVVFETGSTNDFERGGSKAQLAANFIQIKQQIRAQGAVPIEIGNQNDFKKTPRQPDGIHYTPQGHAMVAARVAPQVIAAIGKRK